MFWVSTDHLSWCLSGMDGMPMFEPLSIPAQNQIVVNVSLYIGIAEEFTYIIMWLFFSFFPPTFLSPSSGFKNYHFGEDKRIVGESLGIT